MCATNCLHVEVLAPHFARVIYKIRGIFFSRSFNLSFCSLVIAGHTQIIGLCVFKRTILDITGSFVWGRSQIFKLNTAGARQKKHWRVFERKECVFSRGKHSSWRQVRFHLGTRMSLGGGAMFRCLVQSQVIPNVSSQCLRTAVWSFNWFINWF